MKRSAPSRLASSARWRSERVSSLSRVSELLLRQPVAARAVIVAAVTGIDDDLAHFEGKDAGVDQSGGGKHQLARGVFQGQGLSDGGGRRDGDIESAVGLGGRAPPGEVGGNRHDHRKRRDQSHPESGAPGGFRGLTIPPALGWAALNGREVLGDGLAQQLAFESWWRGHVQRGGGRRNRWSPPRAIVADPVYHPTLPDPRPGILAQPVRARSPARKPQSAVGFCGRPSTRLRPALASAAAAWRCRTAAPGRRRRRRGVPRSPAPSSPARRRLRWSTTGDCRSRRWPAR